MSTRLALCDVRGPLADLLEKLSGNDGEDWLRGLNKFLRKEAWVSLRIDRTTPFDPVHFIGKGWSIWRGQVDGDGLTGDEDQDERSLALTEVDLSKIRIETCLHNRETRVGGEEKFLRLKAAHYIRLDAKVFQTLWERKEIPEPWKEEVDGNTRLIFFDGTILRSPSGDRRVLCLDWSDGGWRWSCGWLGLGWYAAGPSAVLAS